MSVFLSIITVVLNDRRRLYSTLESLKYQTSSDFEWVVVDGGSSDGSRDLITDTKSVFESMGVGLTSIFEADDGLYDAMNKGVWAAQGQYVMLLNAGDILSGPNALAHAITFVRSTGSPKMAFFGAVAHYPGELTVSLPAKACWPAVRHSLPASHQATWIDRQTHQEVLYDPKYRVSADYFVVASIATSGVSTKSYCLTMVDLDKSEASVSYRNPFTHLKDCARIQRSVLQLSIGYVAFSFLNRASKKIFWMVAASPRLRWIARSSVNLRSLWMARRG